MSQVNVYIMSNEDMRRINARNRKFPHGPQIIVCDHGIGPSVEVTTVNNIRYQEWRNLLNDRLPIISRPIEIATIEDDLDITIPARDESSDIKIRN